MNRKYLAAEMGYIRTALRRGVSGKDKGGQKGDDHGDDEGGRDDKRADDDSGSSKKKATKLIAKARSSTKAKRATASAGGSGGKGRQAARVEVRSSSEGRALRMNVLVQNAKVQYPKVFAELSDDDEGASAGPKEPFEHDSIVIRPEPRPLPIKHQWSRAKNIDTDTFNGLVEKMMKHTGEATVCCGVRQTGIDDDKL